MIHKRHAEEDSSEQSMPPRWTKSEEGTMEAIRGDPTLTEEELELAAAIRKARAKEDGHHRSRRHRARKRDEDLDGYRAQITAQKMAWSHRNPEKVLKIAAKVRNKAKEEQRFWCDDCQQPFATQTALDKHNISQIHLDCVADIQL